MMPMFNKTPLAPWKSNRDFLTHFMDEYFTFKKPMHQYVLPPFTWEKKQFDLLRKDCLEMFHFDICPWPTSIPRPILYKNAKDKKKQIDTNPRKYIQDIVDQQLKVMQIYFSKSPKQNEKQGEIEEKVIDEIRALKSLETLKRS
jgi:hypothetical protein